MTTTKSFIVAVAVMAALPSLRSQTPAPTDTVAVRSLLERDLASWSMGLSHLGVTYAVRFTPSIPAAELFDRWRVGPSILVGLDESIFASEQRLAFRSQSPGDEGTAPDLRRVCEVVCDGSSLLFADNDFVCSKYDRSSREISSGAKLFRSRYLEAIQVRMVDSVELIGALPFASTLKSLADGAMVDIEQGGVARISQDTAADEKRVFWLDIARKGAVLSWEEVRNGKRCRRTQNSDFVPVGGIWLPRRSRVEWFAWPTVPAEIADTPLLTADISVSRLSTEVDAADLQPRDRRAGSQIHDARLQAGASGPADHAVPYTAAALVAAFDRLRPRGGWGASLALRIGPWLALHAAVIVAAVFGRRGRLLPVRRTSRGGDREADEECRGPARRSLWRW